jgi:ZIP family zinc transporter
VGFGAGDIKKAVILTLGIAIQNIPEGTAVALPLRSKGYSKLNSFYIATLTGLVEPLGGILGVSLVVIFSKLLPLALSFAAGCMLYVISGEIIPESHREGFGKVATIWLVVGFVLMMILENIFK